MQRDHAWRSARHGGDLAPPAEIGTLAGSGAYGRQFPAHVADGLPAASRAQRLPHPLGDGHAAGPGRPLRLTQLGFVEQDLQPSHHGVSMRDSSC